MTLKIAFTIDSVEFTPEVIAGTASLGGSESACLGLARALAARGHRVHIFTTQLGKGVPAQDHAGVTWHSMGRLAQWALYEDFDVAVALRQPAFLQQIPAKFRVLWAQDLMANETMKQYVMALGWAYDAIAYVSAFHRKQWEGWLPELAPLAYVTKNGHDAALAAAMRATAVKKPHQIIHISRPERGLIPLLQMWPMLRAERPEATLALCRYSSMYDPQGWGAICKNFDQLVAEVNAEVGGIEWLGELGKPALYQAIAESAVMWYPGVASFGETSCIAAIEAQACGTPFVGSFKGALPETAPHGVLVPGDAEADADYHAASVRAVVAALDGCRTSTFDYRRQVTAGLQHVEGYTYEAIAAEWEGWLLEAFRARYETEKAGILRRLDYDDDLVNAKIVAAELGTPEAAAVAALADRVITGHEHTADHYAAFALTPEQEVSLQGGRHDHVVKAFDGCQQMIDIAGGNGAFGIRFALADPTRHVTVVDFSAANIAAGRAYAEQVGVADRVTFITASVWDMERQQPSDWLQAHLASHAGAYDGLFCGEFLEHVADCTGLIDALEALVAHRGRVVWTTPFGPMGRLATRHTVDYRSHVHHFRPADLDALFGQKEAISRWAIPWPTNTGRGEFVGQWLISYRRDGATGTRPLERRMLLRPYSRLTAGLIVNDTLDLRRCLDGVWPIVDELILGDCGCRPGELEQIVKEFPRKTRILPIGPVHDLPGGFSEARNRVLEAAAGEWFFWIDADETLIGAADLGKYLDGPLFTGYVVPQNHLYLDARTHADVPTRVFRTGHNIKFYGCVHEQPQQHDENGEIVPCLKLADVQIAHTGYLHEGLRRHKAITRNLPLLVRDQQMFPTRELGKVLVLRDHANLAQWSRESAGGALTDSAKEHFTQVVGLFEKYFSDPANKYHALARPFYEAALRAVDGALEVEVGLAVKRNGLGDTYTPPARFWVRTPEQAQALLARQVTATIDALAPVTMDVDPLAVEVRA